MFQQYFNDSLNKQILSSTIAMDFYPLFVN